MNVGVGKPGSTDHRENIQVLARSCPWLLFANQKPESFRPFPTSVPGSLLSSLVAVFCSLGAV